MPDTATLHMLCGKIASGKSTLAAELGRQPGTVLISEDDWLSALFGDEMATLADYVRCAGRLREAMGPHISALLNAGTSVVLDFQANTVDARGWMRGLIDETGADHVLHVLDLSDEQCLARLRVRNAGGDHPFDVTEDQFHKVTRHYVPPDPSEGFTILTHPAGPDDPIPASR